MPFRKEMQPYTRASLMAIRADQIGVYGIFKGNIAVYIGSGDIRERLLGHFNGDNACIADLRPDHWAAEVITASDLDARERAYIREYKPLCNRIVLK